MAKQCVKTKTMKAEIPEIQVGSVLVIDRLKTKSKSTKLGLLTLLRYELLLIWYKLGSWNNK